MAIKDIIIGDDLDELSGGSDTELLTKEPPKAKRAAKENIAQASNGNEYDEITYLPQDGDPLRIEWNGVKFSAMVPVRVSRKQTVLVPIVQYKFLPDGTRVSQAIETRIPMVEMARSNKFFMVNGERPAEVVSARMRVPTDPDQYRGYAIAWIAGSTSASTMDARWKAEAILRERCGCTDTDMVYLMPFFEARVTECSGAEDAGRVT